MTNQPAQDNTTDQLFALLNTLTPLPPQPQPQPHPHHPHKRLKLHHPLSADPPLVPAGPSGLSSNHLPSVHRPHLLLSPPTTLTIESPISTLKKMIENSNLLDKIQQIKDTQDQFELRAIDHRNQMEAERDRALKKLTSDPSTTSLNEAKIEKLKLEYESKLKTSDQSVLSRWDQLRNQQQLALQKLQVPMFIESDQPAEIDQQKLVMEYLIKSLNDRTSE